MTEITTEELDRLAEEGADLSEYFDESMAFWSCGGTATFKVTIPENLIYRLTDEAFRRGLSLNDAFTAILTEWCDSHKSDKSNDGPAAA